MSSKSGRVTFSSHNEYTITKVYGVVDDTTSGRFAAALLSGKILAGGVGYAAKRACSLGDHYLARDETTGTISERTSDRGAVPDACIFPTYEAAWDAIETWRRQKEQETNG